MNKSVPDYVNLSSRHVTLFTLICDHYIILLSYDNKLRVRSQYKYYTKTTHSRTQHANYLRAVHLFFQK